MWMKTKQLYTCSETTRKKFKNSILINLNLQSVSNLLRDLLLHSKSYFE